MCSLKISMLSPWPSRVTVFGKGKICRQLQMWCSHTGASTKNNKRDTGKVSSLPCEDRTQRHLLQARKRTLTVQPSWLELELENPVKTNVYCVTIPVRGALMFNPFSYFVSCKVISSAGLASSWMFAHVSFLYAHTLVVLYLIRSVFFFKVYGPCTTVCSFEESWVISFCAQNDDLSSSV